MRFLMTICWAIIGIAPLVAAPLEAETHVPYIWRIVIHTPSHPAITEPFRTQLQRDLKASLTPIVGDGGMVEIVDLASFPINKREPLWKKFLQDGWPALDHEEFRTLTGIKTHFLRISVRDRGIFRLEARQHDGFTGLTSPVLRVQETQAAETIGRLAGLLIGKDLGPTGTIERDERDPKSVRVKFRAGAVGPFKSWLHTGDILSFAVIFNEPQPIMPEPKRGAKPPTVEVPPKRGGKPQEYTLLRVRAVLPDGECACDVLTRFKQPFVGGRDVVGYRCMKLTTEEAPLKLRIVGSDGEAPEAKIGIEAWATEKEFTSAPTPRDSLDQSQGIFRSARPMRNMACVVIRLGASRREPFPVPIFGGEHATTLKFAIREEEIAKAEYEQACERLRGRVLDALSAQIELYKGLSKLITDGENAKALERAKAGLLAANASIKEYSAELERLRKQPLKDAFATRILASSEDQLKLLGEGTPELEKKIAALEVAVAKAKDPIEFEKEFRASEMVRSIAYHVGRGEVPEALDIYDLLIEFTKEEKAKQLKVALATSWAPKNDEVRTARQYLLEVWRKATAEPEWEMGLKKLPEIVTTLSKNEDHLGLRNLISSIQMTYARMKEILDRLDENNDTDKPAILKLQQLADGLRKIEESAQESLKKLDPKKE